jgi:hypothetical protein
MKESILKFKNVQVITREQQKEITGGQGVLQFCLMNPPACWLK